MLLIAAFWTTSRNTSDACDVTKSKTLPAFEGYAVPIVDEQVFVMLGS